MKAYEVGKAQKMVLDALNKKAESFQDAERIFEELNIVVIPVRVGRTSVPHVSLSTRRMAAGDSYSSSLAVLAQWMDESDAAMVTPKAVETVDEVAETSTGGAKQQVYGPYRIKRFGGMYEVVSMLDNHSNRYEELRPRRVYAGQPNSRQTAYQAMVRLNRRWQDDHMMDDDLLKYWQEATN